MPLGKYRTRFSAVGLGDMQVRELSPSAGTEFLNAGHIDQQGTEIGEFYEEEILRDERGNVSNILYHTHGVTHATNLQQLGIDEINLIRNSAGKLHALRYSGMVNADLFQYYCMEQAKINPNFARRFAAGKNPLPFRALALKQDDSSFDIPELYVLETAGRIRTEHLQLWVSPRHSYSTETSRLLDVSGFARHGVLNSDFATIWQQTTNPAEFLRFDGVNDFCDFGDILDDDGVSDLLFEAWVRVQAANGTFNPLIRKKTASTTIVGYAIWRNVANQLIFHIADGTNFNNIASTTTILQNVWKHIAVAIDRNGNAQLYINGVADGAPSSVAAVASASNSAALQLAGTTDGVFGQIDKGDFRVYNFGAGGLPSDVATIILNHYSAEKSYYGL